MDLFRSRWGCVWGCFEIFTWRQGFFVGVDESFGHCDGAAVVIMFLIHHHVAGSLMSRNHPMDMAGGSTGGFFTNSIIIIHNAVRFVLIYILVIVLT
jgi:hypothetical protein